MTYKLELFHINDQQTTSNSVLNNIPGLSAVLNALRQKDSGANHSLFIGSGDTYIPGNFSEASDALYGVRSLGELQIQNELGLDAIAVGNHEFDSPILSEGFAELISAKDDEGEAVGSILGAPYTGATFPFLSTNLDFSGDTFLSPLVVPGGQAPQAKTLTSSVIFTKDDQKIAVIGATTPGLPYLTSPGGVVVTPAASAQLLTDAELAATAEVIQAEVDALKAANPDLNKIILASHMQVFDYEATLAAQLKDVDVIIAGGSEPVTGDANDVPREGDVKSEEYPTWVTNAGGTQTAVVTEAGDYDYIGRLVIEFDADGNLIKDSYDADQSGSWATDEAGVKRAAAHAGVSVEGLEDPEIVQIVNEVKSQISSVLFNTVGFSDVFLNSQRGTDVLTRSDRDGVRTQETNLGNLTADANLAVAAAYDPEVLVSIKNGGGIRADIGDSATRGPNLAAVDSDLGLSRDAGSIVQGDIQGTLAFNNGLRLLTLTKQELIDVLEHGVGALPTVDGRFPQVAGIKMHYDSSAEAGSRLQHVDILNGDGEVQFNLLKDGAISEEAPDSIRIVTLDFLSNPRFDENGVHTGAGDSYPFPNFNQDAALGDTVSNKTYKRINPVQLEDVLSEAGSSTFADPGSEQDALAEYLMANHATTETAFQTRDVGRAFDTRIMDTAFQPAPVNPDQEIIGDPKGAQTLKGKKSNDVITAFKGKDTLVGKGGDDVLDGGAGKDSLAGGKGHDVLDGGNKSDELSGGKGQDRFVLSKGKDSITDFDLSKDHIAIPADADVRFKDTGDHVKIVGDGYKTTLLNVSYQDFIAEMPIAHL